MKLIKHTLLQLLFVLLGFYSSAQNLTINGSCVTNTGSLVQGGDASNTTFNGKPVYYNAALAVNFQGSPITTSTYLYYALAAELGTPENRWVVAYDGQPYYYFISEANTAPTGVYLPFDTLAVQADCGGSVTIGVTCVPPTLAINPPTPACQNTTATLTATTPSLQTNGFTGSFAIANWSLSNTNADGTVNTASAPASIALTSGNNGSDASGNTNYTVTVPTTGTISFNWSYATTDGAAFDYPNVIVNGVTTLFTGYSTSGTNNQSGTMTVNVTAGQSFSFNMFTFDNTFGSGTVVISNFLVSDLPQLQWVATNGGTISGPSNQLSVNVTTSGTYTVTASNGGCSASDSVNFTFTPTTTNGSVTTSICDGDTYVWPANGQSYTTAQTNLTHVVGCNTATLNLTITPVTTNGSVTTSICNGATYIWPANGQSYTTAQTNLTHIVGCNTATLNLTITPVTTNGSVSTSICDGATYTWPANGQTYTTTQTNLTHTVGCNTATLNLIVTPNTTNGSVTTSICDGATYIWPANGQSYTTAQTNLTHIVGCNTATLNLSISPFTTNGSVTTTICQGVSYTWPANGQSYTTEQTNLTHVVGCNTATLNLTVTPVTNTGSITQVQCDGSYTWPLPFGTGLSYSSNQVNLTNVVGCNTATLSLVFTGTTAPLTITQTGSTSLCDPQTVQLCSSIPARSAALYALAVTGANSIARYTTNFTTHTLVRDTGYTGPSATTNYGFDRNPITGQVYIIKESSGRRLFTLDLATNVMVPIGLVLSTTGNNFVIDFTFDNFGIMYAVFNNGTIQKIDYNNPALTPTSFASGLPSTSAGITFDFDANRLLYSSGTTGSKSLYQINNLGVASFLYFYSFGNSGQGIEYVGNNTCYLSGTFGDSIYRLDLSTAATTAVLAPTLFSSAIKDLMYIPSVSLQWSNTSGNLGTSTCINVTPTTTTSYNLTMTNEFGCTQQATYSVTVNPGVITNNGSVTQTQCGGTYTWPLPFGTGLTYSSSQNISNAVGCNTATLNLTITPNTTFGSVTTSAQTAYTWQLPFGNGQTYTTSQTGLTNTVGCNTATLNLTITGVVVPVNTFTVGQSCGATITNLAVTINTPPVLGAVSYTFRLRNMVTLAPAQLIVRPVNSFALSNFAGITLGTLYQVEVSVNNGPFGPPCLVNTPAPFANIGAQCGTTLTSMGQWIYATYVPSVKGYRFRVTNTVTSAVQIYDTELNRFSFNQLANRAFGTLYYVEVALKNTDNTYLPYSDGCNISTPAFPTSTIRPTQCGLPTPIIASENIAAVIISGATGYRFNLVNAAQPYNVSLDRALNTFTLSMFAGLQPSTTYEVRVAVNIGGVWGPFGNPCNITTAPLTKVNLANIIDDFKAIAFPNPFADDFTINVTSTSQNDIQIRVYDMLGKQVENLNIAISDIENLQLGAAYPSGVYNVIVSQGETTKNLRVIKR